MGQYAYQVRDAGGSSSSGVLTAASAQEASRVLRNEGNVIIDLYEQRSSVLPSAVGRTSRKRARRDDVIFFASQLAVMVDTGVPLPDALDGIAEQTAAEGFRAVLQDVSEQVKSGTDFSAALAKYPRVFGRLFVAMVKASEASGTLGRMLQRISKYLEHQRQVRKRVKGALVYPAALLGFCLLVVIGMLTFVLPRFEQVYAGRQAVLPTPTRALLGLSHFLIDQYLLLLAGVAAAVLAGWLFFRSPGGQVALDRARLGMPVLGKIYHRACTARSLRTLSTLVATGVGVLESMEITAEVSGNVFFHRMWRRLRDRLREGAALSQEMAQEELVPRCICQMVSAGEQSGKLPQVLDRVAGFCEEDLESSVRTATSLIEPAMIIIMGFIVGGIAIALLLPVFRLSQVVAR